MSPMKPTAHVTVNKAHPINANNAEFLRVMPGVYTLSRSRQHFPIQKETAVTVAKDYCVPGSICSDVLTAESSTDRGAGVFAA